MGAAHEPTEVQKLALAAYPNDPDKQSAAIRGALTAEMTTPLHPGGGYIGADGHVHDTPRSRYVHVLQHARRNVSLFDSLKQR